MWDHNELQFPSCSATLVFCLLLIITLSHSHVTLLVAKGHKSCGLVQMAKA